MGEADPKGTMTAGDGPALAPAAALAPEELIRRLRDLPDEGARRPLLALAVAGLGSDPIVAALKAEAERLWYVDPHASLRLAECIVLAGEIVGRPDHVALGLMAKGDALRLLGRYPDSVALLDDAGERFLALGDEVGWARTRIGWVVSTHRLGRGLEVFEVVERARDVLVRHGEQLRAAGLTLNTAWVCTEMGRYEQALRLYDEAQALYHSLGAAGEIRAAWATANKAIVLTLFGDFRSALDLHHEARDVFASRGETVAVLRQDQNIAYVHAGLGEFTRALQLLSETYATAEQAGLEADATTIALDMVECYSSLNRHREALDLARETIERCRHGGTPTQTARAQVACAEALSRLGDVETALELLGEATETLDRVGLASEAGSVALQRAGLHAVRGAWSAAEQEARRAWEVFAERGLVVRQTQASLVRARAALARGDVHRAAVFARAALETSHVREISWLAHESHHVLARVAETSGDLAGALTVYQDAVACIERVQSRQAGELRTNFLDDKLAVYHDAIDLCLRLDRPGDALDYLERAKSRALVDYLVATPEVRPRTRDANSQALLEELTNLRQEHNWFYGRLYGRGPVAGTDTSPAEVSQLEQAIRERERRISRVLERVALQAHDGFGATAPSVTAHVEPPRLSEDTVLLQYYLHDGTAAVFVRAGNDLRVVPLATNARQLQSLMVRWQLSLDATARAIGGGTPQSSLRRNASGILSALYRALVQPVAGYLMGRNRLVVIPYGPTHAVPWHALFDGDRYLLDQVEVVTCPSSALLRLCSDRRLSPGRAADSALVVAFGNGGRLPHVVEEARTVAGLFPGERYLEEAATVDRVVAAAPRHGIVHLAAHGEARLDNPTFAHLQLADGQLTMADVFNLPLDGALVTLSACETGRAVVTGGDELIGLARGFLYAGASTLVQSLWRVEDDSTARLMERFYGALRAGSPRGAALREAQLSLLAEGYSPYQWAPFQLVGDAGSVASATPALRRK